MILVLRVIQAFGGGFATVTSNVFIRDWYQGKQVAKLITITSMIMMLAPLFAPIIGATLIHFNGWQAVFYFLFAFASVLFVAFWILIPESRDKSFITNKITANQLLDKYKLFFSDKQSVIFLFSISFSMAGMYVFITNASFIYINYFKIEQNIFPLFFGANIVLNIILSLLNSYLLKFYPPVRLLKAGLFLQLLSGVLLLITVQFESPWLYAFFGGIVLYIGSLGLIFGNGTAVILDHNPQVSGSANATLGIFRFVLSFLIGSIIVLFHSGNLIPVGTALFICTFTGNVLFMVANRSEKKMN